ncbi:hypothetical protein DL240_13760 [Lujinxingia litoralis]|uniref:Gamma-butyrobetaine hydroxylase-like N-terminal domain-containing protein n=2 Tax=Lujinxingia litoralis TaxID=2211119 RepID=A0A328C318_9DELT|nr:hypothetical protein DL240_13760 [Lujinxingia litoralis]
MGYVPHPTEIEYKSAQRALRMSFSDDHESVYPTRYLRGFCPCARCQGHTSGPHRFIEHEPAQAEVVDVRQVGNYAINIVFADGHDTGIYSFQRLRELCPCPRCMPTGLKDEYR